MTRFKRVAAVFAVAVVIAGLAWGFLLRSRNEELSTLKSMLPGAEILNDQQLISEPSLIRTSTLRRWVFRIDRTQMNRLLAQCRALETRFPKNQVEHPVGCVAAFYNDPSAYRYVTLLLHPRVAEISALYMSATDFSAMVKGPRSSETESSPTPKPPEKSE